jgi:hypothetical protein
MRILNRCEIASISGADFSASLMFGIYSGIQGFNWSNTIYLSALACAPFGMFPAAVKGGVIGSSLGWSTGIAGGIGGGLLGLTAYAGFGALESAIGYYIGSLAAPYLKTSE